MLCRVHVRRTMNIEAHDALSYSCPSNVLDDRGPPPTNSCGYELSYDYDHEPSGGDNEKRP
eukprot:SAG31_NODE_442_length_15661_cov_4.132245_15_plen_61_part_00